MTNHAAAQRRRLATLEEAARRNGQAREERIREALANDPDGRARRLFLGVLCAHRSEAEAIGGFFGAADAPALRRAGLEEYHRARRERGMTYDEHYC